MDDVETLPTQKPRRWRWLLVPLLLVLGTIAIGLLWLDSGAGQRWAINKLANRSSKSGFQIVIGDFQGSLYSRALVKNVQLRDTKGTFLTIHAAQIDWSPATIWRKDVEIRALDIDNATWHYVPKFNPADPNAPLLPDWDISIDRLTIARLTLAPPVAGKQSALKAHGTAHIADRRVQAKLDMAALDSSDTARIRLDAVPDDNRFDADVQISAPGKGLFATLARWQPGGTVALSGKGDFKNWRGKLAARTGAVDALTADLHLQDGVLSVDGDTRAPEGLSPRLTTLLASFPHVSATIAAPDKLLQTRGTLSGGKTTLGWNGKINLATREMTDTTATLVDETGALLPLLDPALKATGAKITATVSGDFRRPDISATLAATKLSWLRYSLETLGGTAKISQMSQGAPWQVALTAKNGKTGLVWLDPKLATLSASGRVRIANGAMTADTLAIKGVDLAANGVFSTIFKTGAWRATIANLATSMAAGSNGNLPLTLRGTASTNARASPVSISVSGTASLARWTGPVEIIRLFGRAPAITANMVVQPNGATRATALSVDGNGSKFTGTLALNNGVIEAELSGRIKSLAVLAPGLPFSVQPNAPVSLIVKGPIENPQIAGQVQSPYVRIGGAALRDVTLTFQPDGSKSWATTLRADAPFGKLAVAAAIETDTSGIGLKSIAGTAGPAIISGNVDISRAGLATGALDIALNQPGQQLAINALLSAENGAQKMDGKISGRNISQSWNGSPLTLGAVNGTVSGLLGKPPTLQADLTLKNAGYQDWQVSDMSVTGRGPANNFIASYKINGARGTTFSLAGNLITRGAQNLPDFIDATASGMIAQKPFKLSSPARLQRTPTGWTLAPTELAYAGGSARVSGATSGSTTDASLELANTSLDLLDFIRPDLGLTGKASGKAILQIRDGKLTVLNGDLALKRVRRAGLFQSSLPLDITGTVGLDGGALQTRLQLRANGRPAGSGDIRILRTASGKMSDGALGGTFTYDGPAEALWGLIGTDANDIRGTLGIAATLAGTLADPQVRGEVQMRGGRYENVSLGLVVNSISADGQFDGAKLSFANAQGTFPAGGTITAKGQVDVSAERNFPAQIDVALVRASVIKRENLAVTATGNLVVTYGPRGGKISGPLVLNEARYRAGGPVSGVVPEIEVREINKLIKASATRAPTRRQALKPFTLDMDVSARERVFVTGLGLTSEWRGSVNVAGTAQAPSLRGQMSLIRGTYDFSGRRFAVDDGVISFQGTSPINPVVNIRASARAGDRDIIIRVTGAASQPDIQFSASPSLPQDEVLSRLLFGTSIQSLSPLEAVQLAAALNQLSSARGGLNVLGQVRRATGIDRLRVVAADKARGSGTALSGGKYLTDRVYVEVSTDGRGYTATIIEVDITRTLSVLSEIATLGGTNVGVKWSKEY